MSTVSPSCEDPSSPFPKKFLALLTQNNAGNNQEFYNVSFPCLSCFVSREISHLAPLLRMPTTLGLTWKNIPLKSSRCSMMATSLCSNLIPFWRLLKLMALPRFPSMKPSVTSTTVSSAPFKKSISMMGRLLMQSATLQRRVPAISIQFVSSMMALGTTGEPGWDRFKRQVSRFPAALP